MLQSLGLHMSQGQTQGHKMLAFLVLQLTLLRTSVQDEAQIIMANRANELLSWQRHMRERRAIMLIA